MSSEMAPSSTFCRQTKRMPSATWLSIRPGAARSYSGTWIDISRKMRRIVETALTTYAAGTDQAMIKPPTAGPAIPLICPRLVRHLMAFSKVSRGTRSGRRAARAGQPRRRAQLSRNSRRYMIEIGPWK